MLCATAGECDSRLVDAAQGAACLADPDACKYKCLLPSADPANSGCVLRAATADCPTELPSFLTPEDASLLNCVTTVGAEQHNNASLEQGLATGLLALESAGPNFEQAGSFLRKDAELLVVFVSDEEDCSTAEGKVLQKEEFGTCLCLPDSDNGGPMWPVQSLVGRYRALKADPEQVHVAVIVGDSLASDPEEVSQDRLAYRQSKCSMCVNPEDAHPLLFNTYICNSKAGKADLGLRFIEFADSFGDNGTRFNVCRHESMVPAVVTAIQNALK